MSEQVGASLVLAQMLLPSQSGPMDQPGGPAITLGADSQPIDSINNNSEAFASLLTELENLQIPTPMPTGENLINVRVATQALPAVEPTPAAGSTPLAAGKALPVPGSLSPLMEAAARMAEPTLPVPAALNTAEIVLKEPDAGLIPPAADPLTPALRELSPPVPAAATGNSNLTPAAATHAPPSPTFPATPTSATEPTARPAETLTVTAPGSPGIDAGSPDSTSADPNTGQRQGEHQGDRQAQPTLSSRGPTITFSTDSLPSATLAASPSSTGSIPGTAASATSQPLALLGSPSQWAEPLAERLAGLAAGNLNTRGVNTAEIRLHPPSLGQLEVRISVSNDQASLIVASASPEVREALQQALPRLDSLLSGLGIELAESEVRERQDDDFQAGADGSAAGDDKGGSAAAESQSEQAEAVGLGLLDTWA